MKYGGFELPCSRNYLRLIYERLNMADLVFSKIWLVVLLYVLVFSLSSSLPSLLRKLLGFGLWPK